MAQVTVTKILDGARNAVFHVSVLGDGLGDVTDEVLIDPTTSFDPAFDSIPSMTIEKLWYDLSGFNARLEFDYLASDTPVWSMSGGQAVQLDFGFFKGLRDRSNELDGSGKLTMTTSGLGAGDFGTLIVHVRKD